MSWVGDKSVQIYIRIGYLAVEFGKPCPKEKSYARRRDSQNLAAVSKEERDLFIDAVKQRFIRTAPNREPNFPAGLVSLLVQAG